MPTGSSEAKVDVFTSHGAYCFNLSDMSIVYVCICVYIYIYIYVDSLHSHIYIYM